MDATSMGTSTLAKTLVLALTLTAFVAVTYGFGVYLFATVVVEMKSALGFGYSTVGLITGAAQIGFLAFAFAGSMVSPIIGGGTLALLSVGLCSACLVGLAYCTNALQAGILLTVLGGCSASVYVPLAEIVTRQVPEVYRARLLGLISSGTSYGVFANGLIVPYAVPHWGWRAVWIVTGVATGILAALAVLVFSRYRLFRDQRRQPERADPPPQVRTTAGRAGQLPIIWAITFLNGLTLLPYQTYLVPIVREELHYPISTAGHVWSMIGAVGMIAGFALGALADRIGIRRAMLMTFAFATFAAAFVWFNVGAPGLYVSALLFGLSFYPIFGLVPAYLSKTLPPDALTKAFGMANVMVGVGGMVGNFVGGWVKSQFGSLSIVYVAITLLLCVQFALVRTLRPDSVAGVVRSPGRFARRS
ncbi:MFS transporter [Burkholderia sp. Ac-20353]|uniref:MFS transporter n=1 Tax=Burkholderia sp. Ac-20353 TaxID=2703894 RepID=UPI00197C720E|nr:MFS transporter [Burkholderia sp. Ac-20353]MBN3788101.1 YbfB/YjiJ family MFS transporter [Burkholderia sp. Ac-20353]